MRKRHKKSGKLTPTYGFIVKMCFRFILWFGCLWNCICYVVQADWIYDSRLIFQMIVTFRFYQVRCSLRVQPRLSVQIEASVSENSNKEISSATVIRGAGTSKIFQILYRNEEVTLKDTVVFRVRLPGNCHYTTTLVLQK